MTRYRLVATLIAWGMMLGAAPDEKKSDEKKSGEKKSDSKKSNSKKAPNVSLQVTVTDESGEPVRGVNVFVKQDSDDGEFEKTERTNAEGAATLTKLPLGSVTVQVIGAGWKSWGANLDLADGENTQKVQLRKN